MTATYEVRFSRSARMAIAVELPEKVAAAALEFILGALSASPRRVGRPLREPLAPLWSARRGDYRVTYEILDEVLIVHVVAVVHRRDAYR